MKTVRDIIALAMRWRFPSAPFPLDERALPQSVFVAVGHAVRAHVLARKSPVERTLRSTSRMGIALYAPMPKITDAHIVAQRLNSYAWSC